MSARFGARMIARTNRAALEEAYERLGSGNKGLFLAALPVPSIYSSGRPKLD